MKFCPEEALLRLTAADDGVVNGSNPVSRQEQEEGAVIRVDDVSQNRASGQT